MGITAAGTEAATKGAEGAAGAGAAKGGEAALAGGAGADALGAAGAGLGTDALGAGGAAAVGADAIGGVGAAGGLAPGSLDALAATGNLAGEIPASAGGIAGGATGAAGATALAPPAGVSSPVGVDPTAAISGGAGNPIDATGGAGNPLDAAKAAMGGAGNPAGSSGLSLDKLISGAESSIAKNPLGIGLAGAGLGYNILQGQKQSAAVRAMQDQANSQGAVGAQLESYLTQGKLPPGMQTKVDQGTAAAKARAISNAGTSGMSTDPSKNSALAEELNSIDLQRQQEIATIGEQLMTQGLSASGLSSQMLTSLAQLDATQTANMSKAISGFAGALSGGPKVIQLGNNN